MTDEEIRHRHSAHAYSYRLERQLANDEPKCGNCQHWFALIRGTEDQAIGKCGKLHHDGVMTTDLSICSKWEKRHAQTEAEAQ